MEARLRSWGEQARLEKLQRAEGMYPKHPRDGPWGKTDRPGQTVAIGLLSCVVRRHEGIIADGKWRHCHMKMV